MSDLQGMTVSRAEMIQKYSRIREAIDARGKANRPKTLEELHSIFDAEEGARSMTRHASDSAGLLKATADAHSNGEREPLAASVCHKIATQIEKMLTPDEAEAVMSGAIGEADIANHRFGSKSGVPVELTDKLFDNCMQRFETEKKQVSKQMSIDGSTPSATGPGLNM